jgi:hypothetical protein
MSIRKRTRKLERYYMYHPRSDLGRLYVKKNGRRSLLQIFKDVQSRDNLYCRIFEHEV